MVERCLPLFRPDKAEREFFLERGPVDRVECLKFSLRPWRDAHVANDSRDSGRDWNGRVKGTSRSMPLLSYSGSSDKISSSRSFATALPKHASMPTAAPR